MDRSQSEAQQIIGQLQANARADFTDPSSSVWHNLIDNGGEGEGEEGEEAAEDRAQNSTIKRSLRLGSLLLIDKLVDELALLCS